MKTDYLKEDPPIYGQDWGVVSFVNPEDMVLKKYLHYVNRFMVADVNKTLTASAMQMVKLLKSQMRKKIDDLLDKLRDSRDPEDKHMGQILEKRYREMDLDEDEFVDECRRRYELDDEEITDRYKMYLAEHRQEMDNDFDSAHDHATSLRGFKVRGNYQRLTDAQARAKFLRNDVEEGIHTFVVPVGKWFPVDMEADEVQDQEYMLPGLNQMMGKYHEGIHARNQHYRERKKEMEEDASKRNTMNVKERLQAKLRENRQAKMKKEVETQQLLMKEKSSSVQGETQAVQGVEKKKKKKSKKSDPSAGNASEPSNA